MKRKQVVIQNTIMVMVVVIMTTLLLIVPSESNAQTACDCWNTDGCDCLETYTVAEIVTCAATINTDSMVSWTCQVLECPDVSISDIIDAYYSIYSNNSMAAGVLYCGCDVSHTELLAVGLVWDEITLGMAYARFYLDLTCDIDPCALYAAGASVSGILTVALGEGMNFDTFVSWTCQLLECDVSVSDIIAAYESLLGSESAAPMAAAVLFCECGVSVADLMTAGIEWDDIMYGLFAYEGLGISECPVDPCTLFVGGASVSQVLTAGTMLYSMNMDTLVSWACQLLECDATVSDIIDCFRSLSLPDAATAGILFCSCHVPVADLMAAGLQACDIISGPATIGTYLELPECAVPPPCDLVAAGASASEVLACWQTAFPSDMDTLVSWTCQLLECSASVSEIVSAYESLFGSETGSFIAVYVLYCRCGVSVDDLMAAGLQACDIITGSLYAAYLGLADCAAPSPCDLVAAGASGSEVFECAMMLFSANPDTMASWTCQLIECGVPVSEMVSAFRSYLGEESGALAAAAILYCRCGASVADLMAAGLEACDIITGALYASFLGLPDCTVPSPCDLVAAGASGSDVLSCAALYFSSIPDTMVSWTCQMIECGVSVSEMISAYRSYGGGESIDTAAAGVLYCGCGVPVVDLLSAGLEPCEVIRGPSKVNLTFPDCTLTPCDLIAGGASVDDLEDCVASSYWESDEDGDGYPTDCDCDDTDPDINQGIPEVCNGQDDDCDGLVDDDDPNLTGSPWYEDNDGDGYGNPNACQQACTQPQGYVADNTDCDDTDAAIYPGAQERCNGLDDDCDTVVPANEADNDGDGLLNCADNCPDAPNPGQKNTDGDGQGDACDPDDDNDGVADGPDTDRLNPDVCQDIDSDGCDDCAVGTDDFGPDPDNDPANDGPDADADGICDGGDNCPDVPNEDQADSDVFDCPGVFPKGTGDGVVVNGCPDGLGDACDNCPDHYNPDQEDFNNDGIGNLCQDTDGDGMRDSDEGDGDRDGDGLADYEDYDPTGYFYNEVSGGIVFGGRIDVIGPGTITIIHDGSSGYYQFTVSPPPGGGTYDLVLTLPPSTLLSTTCLDQGTLDPDPVTDPNPIVLGHGEVGSSGLLSSSDCTDYYTNFYLENGDPFIFNNNFPLRVAPSVGWGDTCMDYMLPGEPDEYLEGSHVPTEDWWAVAFYNPGGVAKVRSLAFRFMDIGTIDLYVFTAGDMMPEDGLCQSGQLVEVADLLDLPLAPASQRSFWGRGLTQWEAVTLDDCVTVDSKRWFFVAWQKTWNSNPRIMGDNWTDDPERVGTHSWIWNAEMGEWKCFPDLEYCVEVCLDYQPGCIEIHEPEITWTHTEHGMYPCVCEFYNVTATFRNECDEDRPVSVQFLEAPWGFFMVPTEEVLCSQEIMVPARSKAESGNEDEWIPGEYSVHCDCKYHHDDMGDAWSRNIIVRWTRDMYFCFEETEQSWYTSRRCRRTIWPDMPYGSMPSGTYGPIPIPIINDEDMEMRFDAWIPVTTVGSWTFAFSGGFTADTMWLDPGEEATLWLMATSVADIAEPLIVRVAAMKCNGEIGEVEIEFMPYSEPLSIQPIDIDSLKISRMYPCEDLTSFDIEFDVVNLGTDVAYPAICYGIAQWGFFFPQEEKDCFIDLAGIGVSDTKHYVVDDDMFVWQKNRLQYSRNTVLKYMIESRHCYQAEALDSAFYRDCRRVIWPGRRWPWEGALIPLPVYNEEPFEATIEVAVIDSTVPDEWLYFLNRTSLTLGSLEADTAFLSVIPQGLNPPLPPDHVIAVRATKGFCGRDTVYASLEFLPYACLCIPDYLGKVVENLPGKEPELVAGDTVFVSLMLENDDSVTAVELDLEYDPLYLFPDTTRLTHRSEGMRLIENIPSPGLYHIIIDFTLEPHHKIAPSRIGYRCEQKSSEDTLHIASVAFLIQDDPPPGVCSNITTANLIVSGLPGLDGEPEEQVCACSDHGQICFGGYQYPMKCDVTGDTTLTLFDLLKILRHIIRIEVLDGDIGVPGDPRWAADVNGDHAINILDLMKCINRSVGRVDPKAAAPDVVVRDLVSLDGWAVGVPVEVVSDVDVVGVMVRFGFDRAVLAVGEPQLTERAERMTLDYGVVDDELVVLVYSLTGEVIEAGTGSVVRVPFEAVGGAEGEVAIEVIEPVVFTADAGIYFGEGLVVVKVEGMVPAEYDLAQNYPNPFNPITTIRYAIPSTEQRTENGVIGGNSKLNTLRTTLVIYNVLGQEVRTLVDGVKEAGYYTVTWDGRDGGGNDVSSGVYFYRLRAGDFTATRRMVLMK
jgi:hypothetical protein